MNRNPLRQSMTAENWEAALQLPSVTDTEEEAVLEASHATLEPTTPAAAAPPPRCNFLAHLLHCIRLRQNFVN